MHPGHPFNSLLGTDYYRSQFCGEILNLTPLCETESEKKRA